MAQLRRASAATPRRTVRLTRSIQAVFSRPDLARDQACRHLPTFALSALAEPPQATAQHELGSAEKYTFSPSLVKRGMQKGGQDLWQGVDDQVRHVLRAGTQMEHRKKRASRGRWPATERRTCVALRSLVRSSSTCRCGSQRVRNVHSCNV